MSSFGGLSSVAAMIRILILGLCVALAAACDDESSPPPESPAPAPVAEQIIGNERFGWDQVAATSAELATLRYLVYVDGAAGAELQDASCAATPDAGGFACSARLPPMSPGLHSLALSAFIEEDVRLESARSSPLNVILVGQATITRGAAFQPGQMIVETGDGLRLRVAAAAEGLEEPTDLAFAADGRIFIAERAGRVRIVRDGRLLPSPAATLRDVLATDRSGLLAIALDPDFDRTQFVYLVYTADSGFRLARFRAAGDVLSERAVLLDAIAPSARQPAASLRFGPDAKLYLGVDDGDTADAAGDLGSFGGKVLRLNADATTPPDQAGGTPVFALNVHRPSGVDWDSSGALWIVESGLLQVVVADSRHERRGRTVARYSLPEGTGASALGFYHAGLIPAFQGNLFIAGSDDRAILRLQFDRRQPTKVVSTERLLLDAFDTVRATGIGRDGAIYFCTSNALMKIAPE
jgi:glucose/arabinose dehydrogenase